MIGVIARTSHHEAVREFFELFKTPWEFYSVGKQYAVIVDAEGATPPPPAADVVFVYGSQPTEFDRARGWQPRTAHRSPMLSWNGREMPLYRAVATLPADGTASQLVLGPSAQTVARVVRDGRRTVIRVGYDLFEEVRHLLTHGQPPAHAAIPALERHIAFLRSTILACGVPLVEIPPVPDGHAFSVCLTHDLDHPSLRFHGLDHTTLGFLFRATVGSVLKALRGRLSLGSLARNLAAAVKLPFVHFGWAEDFWWRFDHYLEIEKGLGSTFFVIPTRGTPGRTVDGRAPATRASVYGVADVGERVRSLRAAGSEIAVHGIDAWIDAARGRREREAVATESRATVAGVRMHWLFFDEGSPRQLEAAGYSYDSTSGYNEAIGFRAGTLQVFKPLTVHTLLELPLNVMDTALFYPTQMNLTPAAALKAVRPLVDEAARHGGVLTVNWHDRSLAPERLWGDFYLQLVDELKRRNAWFPTAGQVISWFRRRRAAKIEVIRRENGVVRIRAATEAAAELPGLRVRVHTGPARFTDLPLDETLDTEVTA